MTLADLTTRQLLEELRARGIAACADRDPFVAAGAQDLAANTMTSLLVLPPTLLDADGAR